MIADRLPVPKRAYRFFPRRRLRERGGRARRTARPHPPGRPGHANAKRLGLAIWAMASCAVQGVTPPPASSAAPRTASAQASLRLTRSRLKPGAKRRARTLSTGSNAFVNGRAVFHACVLVHKPIRGEENSGIGMLNERVSTLSSKITRTRVKIYCRLTNRDMRASPVQASLKPGFRFSMKADMPSFWSGVPNSDRNSARSCRTPSARVVS